LAVGGWWQEEVNANSKKGDDPKFRTEATKILRTVACDDDDAALAAGGGEGVSVICATFEVSLG